MTGHWESRGSVCAELQPLPVRPQACRGWRVRVLCPCRSPPLCGACGEPQAWLCFHKAPPLHTGCRPAPTHVDTKVTRRRPGLCMLGRGAWVPGTQSRLWSTHVVAPMGKRAPRRATGDADGDPVTRGRWSLRNHREQLKSEVGQLQPFSWEWALGNGRCLQFWVVTKA